MEKISKPEQKSTPAICPDCGEPVNLAGPCWMRVSPRPERTQAWHLLCRDRHLAALSKAVYRAKEEREQFASALQLIGRISGIVEAAGTTISDAEAITLIRDQVDGGKPVTS